MTKCTILFVCLTFLCFTSGAKILCIFPTLARSHFYIGEALVRALAAKGHQVTYVSPFADDEKLENVKSVHLSELAKWTIDIRSKVNIFSMAGLPPIFMILVMSYMCTEVADRTMSDPAMQAVLNSNETYDAVISELMFSDFLHGVAYRFKAVSISAATFAPSIFTNYVSSNPSIFSYMPHLFSGYEQRMSFWERLDNFILITLQNIIFKLYYLPQNEKILHKYIPEAPSLHELTANISLHLFNSDPAINGPLPMLPNVVEIAGIHIKPPKKLPDDLQKYLDESEDGVIYFSLGGNLSSKDLPSSIRDAILRVFSKLKHRILWKFEEELTGIPENVMIRKWLPQQDILAHPNLKLFITHGGLLSTIETLHHGVPIIGISVYGDQISNMRRAESRGYGISLPYNEFTEEKFSDALEQILNNSSYSHTAKEISALLRDRSVPPTEKAVHWIEYVIRHKGTPHLRSAAHDLNWYQYYSLDVMIFLISINIIAIKILCMIYKQFCRQRKQKQKQN